MLYFLGNSRSEMQTAEMKRLERENICAFCWEGLRTTGQWAEIVSAHWAATENRYPYERAARHFLLLPYAHVTDMRDLTIAARADFFTILDATTRRFGIADYEIKIRCGDPQVTGATVAHLHVHLIEPA